MRVAASAHSIPSALVLFFVWGSTYWYGLLDIRVNFSSWCGPSTDPNTWRPVGSASFPGEISHSHTYRTPDRFVRKKVVVLGSGPSGTDIALELHRFGVDVTLSHFDGKGKPNYGGLVPQAAPVVELREDSSVVLKDGSVISNVDELLLCTGYAYSMPFLSENSGISTSKDRRAIYGLFMQCVTMKHPTLSLLGMPFKVIPFPMFEDQAKFVGAILSGRVPFAVSPKSIAVLHRKEMEQNDTDVPEKYKHSLDDKQWEYRRRLADWSGGQAPAESIREMYNDASAARENDPLNYRSREYTKLGDGPGEWRVSLFGKDVTGQQDPAFSVTVGEDTQPEKERASSES